MIIIVKTDVLLYYLFIMSKVNMPKVAPFLEILSKQSKNKFTFYGEINCIVDFL